MNFATSTRSCGAARPSAPDRSHRPGRPRRRARASCGVAGVVALALSVSTAATPRPGLDGDPAAVVTAAAHPGPVVVDASTGAAGPAGSLASRSAFVHSRLVCVGRANVRSGPGLSYRVVTTLPRGTRVRGTTTNGWLRLRAGRWIAFSLTCVGGGARTVPVQGPTSFAAWVRAIDPGGNATWRMDHARAHTRGSIRGLTVFRDRGPTRSTVYIQPGMTWAKTKLVMAHEAIHVRQLRYGGYTHSLRVFGSIAGLERSADCGATLILRQQVRGGCRAGDVARVRRLLAGRPA